MGSAVRGRAVQRLHLEDIEAAEEGFSGMDIELSLLSPQRRPWRFVEAELEALSVLDGQMGAALGASGRIHEDNHWFFLPRREPPCWTMNGLQVEKDALHVMPAGGDFLVGASQPVDWLGVKVTPDEFAARRAAVGPPVPPLGFMRFHSGRAQLASLDRAVRLGLRLLSGNPFLIHHERVCARLKDMVLGRLVECTLGDDAAGPPPRGAAMIARLRGYLEEHREEPIFVEGVCAAMGLSDRSLRRLFAEVFETSPARFLRQRRLRLAHGALRSPAGGRGVTDVCYLYGFFDAGRFAADYRELFGELPSVTLKKVVGPGGIAS